MAGLQVPEPGKFLKGLCVVDDVAYFGISIFSAREDRDNPDSDSELAAYDLIGQRLLWRRKASGGGSRRGGGTLQALGKVPYRAATAYFAVNAIVQMAGGGQDWP